MQSVKVNKDKLLETLPSNLANHVADYKSAKAKYPGVVAQAMRKRAADIDAGEKIDTYFDLPEPVSYEQNYKDAIEMLEWSENDTVDLSQAEFKQYVQDVWAWRAQFASSTQVYNGR